MKHWGLIPLSASMVESLQLASSFDCVLGGPCFQNGCGIELISTLRLNQSVSLEKLSEESIMQIQLLSNLKKR